MENQEESAAPTDIEVFVDFVCPWCYLAHGAVQKLQAQHPELHVNWSPFPLHPDTPREGLLLRDLFQGADLDAMHERIHALMDELELPHGERDRTYNTRLAQELLLWAASEDADEALLPLLFQAYFVDNRNLADEDVLLDLVAQAGLDVDAARTALRERSFSEEVDSAWQRAGQYRINGVPAFIGGGYQFSGFQPVGELERFLSFIQGNQADNAS